MGPLVPTIISSEFDLVIALFLGFGFGFILEQAGFSNSRKLVGLFYGYDFVVLKVFLTAGITAMVGVLALGHFGLLDLNLIYVNPTFLKSAIIGGLIMGVGFVVGGFCPGTSVCATFIGKIDAMVFVFGSFLGIYLFMEFYPVLKDMYMADAMGPVKIYEVLGMSAVGFAALMSAIAGGAFLLAAYVESRVNERPFSLSGRRMLKIAFVAMIPFAIVAVTAFTPDKEERVEARINNPVYLNEAAKKALEPDQLAMEIVNNYYRWNIIDVRSPEEYKAWHLPLSINIPLDSMQNREWEPYINQKLKKNIFYSDDLSMTKKAFALAEVLGKGNNYILDGTALQFKKMFFAPVNPGPEASKEAMDLYNFRRETGIKMEDLVRSLERFNSKPKVRKLRKVQGGCA